MRAERWSTVAVHRMPLSILNQCEKQLFQRRKVGCWDRQGFVQEFLEINAVRGAESCALQILNNKWVQRLAAGVLCRVPL